MKGTIGIPTRKKPSSLGKKAFFIPALLLFTSFLAPKDPKKAEDESSPFEDPAFRVGESLSYEIHYEWGGLWTHVAKVRFSVGSDTSRSGSPLYTFEGKGKTLPFYDAFYKVRDLYKSKIHQEGYDPVEFYREVREGGTRYQEHYRFDRDGERIVLNASHREEKDSIPFKKGALDVLTAIYYCRSMDLEALEIDERVPIDLVLGKKLHSTHFTYRGKKTFEHPNGRTYRCHYIEPELIEGSIFQEGDRMKVLVTDDPKKVPIHVESEITVGRIKVYLSDMEGTIDP